MTAQEAIDLFKEKYPNKNIVSIPEDHPTEVICEIDPTIDHPEFNRAMAAIKRSKPHYHKLASETYIVKQGKLKLFVDNKTLILKEGDSYIVRPGQIHFAEGDFTIVEVDSTPGWTTEDHILAPKLSK